MYKTMYSSFKYSQIYTVLHSIPFKLRNVFTVSDPSPARDHQRLTLLELQRTQRMRSLKYSGASDLRDLSDWGVDLLQIWLKFVSWQMHSGIQMHSV